MCEGSSPAWFQWCPWLRALPSGRICQNFPDRQIWYVPKCNTKIVKPTWKLWSPLKNLKTHPAMSAIIEDAERERRDIATYLYCITLKNGYWGNWRSYKATSCTRKWESSTQMMKLCNCNTCATISAFKLVRFIPQKAQVLANTWVHSETLVLWKISESYKGKQLIKFSNQNIGMKAFSHVQTSLGWFWIKV